MSSVFCSKSLAFEHVTQVAIATSTENLGSTTIRIGFANHRAVDLVVKTRPSTSAVELVPGTVKRCLALATQECAGVFQVVVFTGERLLGALAEDDELFIRDQFVQRWRCRSGVHDCGLEVPGGGVRVEAN